MNYPGFVKVVIYLGYGDDSKELFKIIDDRRNFGIRACHSLSLSDTLILIVYPGEEEKIKHFKCVHSIEVME